MGSWFCWGLEMLDGEIDQNTYFLEFLSQRIAKDRWYISLGGCRRDRRVFAVTTQTDF